MVTVGGTEEDGEKRREQDKTREKEAKEDRGRAEDTQQVIILTLVLVWMGTSTMEVL